MVFKICSWSPSRDYLSPSLFIIAIEFQSRGLNEIFTIHNTLHYRTIRGLTVSHLSLEDDFIIFRNDS